MIKPRLRVTIIVSAIYYVYLNKVDDRLYLSQSRRYPTAVFVGFRERAPHAALAMQKHFQRSSAKRFSETPPGEGESRLHVCTVYIIKNCTLFREAFNANVIETTWNTSCRTDRGGCCEVKMYGPNRYCSDAIYFSFKPRPRNCMEVTCSLNFIRAGIAHCPATVEFCSIPPTVRTLRTGGVVNNNYTVVAYENNKIKNKHIVRRSPRFCVTQHGGTLLTSRSASYKRTAAHNSSTPSTGECMSSFRWTNGGGAYK